MPEIYWYYMDGDQVLGPHPEKDLRQRIKTGELSIMTHVMKAEGKSNLYPAHQAFKMKQNTFSMRGFYQFASPVAVLFLMFAYINMYAFTLVEKWGRIGPIAWALTGFALIGAAIVALLQMRKVSIRWNNNIPDQKSKWIKVLYSFCWFLLSVFMLYFGVFLLWGADWSLLAKKPITP